MTFLCMKTRMNSASHLQAFMVLDDKRIMYFAFRTENMCLFHSKTESVVVNHKVRLIEVFSLGYYPNCDFDFSPYEKCG